MPTVRQLFALLREDVEQEAIEETRKYRDDFDTIMESNQPTLRHSLSVCFTWSISKRGYSYWNSIANNPPLKTQQDA